MVELMSDDLKNVLREFRLQLVIHPLWHGLPKQFRTLGCQACDPAACQATDEESGWKFRLEKRPRHLKRSQSVVSREGMVGVVSKSGDRRYLGFIIFTM